MKTANKGAFFFIKKKQVFLMIYAKTNHLKKKLSLPKKLTPNTIYGAVFDKDGRDYIMDKPMTYKDFDLFLKETDEVYDYKDYTPETLYEKLKASGIAKSYTQKWFKDNFAFIDSQIEKLEEM